MEAIMKQIQQQLKQKKVQKASLMKQLEVVNRELELVNRKEEQIKQTLQVLSAYSTPKEEAASNSTTKQPNEEIQEISSNDSPPHTIPKIEKQPLTSNLEEYPPLQDHKNIKKWYVIFNGENKGIYDDWGIANSYILGKNVIHKSYKTKMNQKPHTTKHTKQ